MANDTTKNPWVIDTLSATPILTSWAAVRNFNWVGATTAGHKVTVTDQAGRVIWEKFAQGANQDFEQEFAERGRQVNGLTVTALDSGTLYITFV